MRSVIATVSAALILSGCAVNYSVTPTALATQTVRYDRGTPTVLDDRLGGSIQTTPLGVSEDGRVLIGIAVFNKGTTAANFGIENITATGPDTASLKTYSRDDLAHEAKVKAEWQMFAVALAGAATAYAAQQNAYSTTNGYIAGPRGVTTFSATTYNPTTAALGTAAAGAATGYTLVSIKRSMDDTLDHLNGSILQTTTVDPGQSYGGELVADMPKGKDWPKSITVHARWNGDAYDFGYVIAKAK